MSGTRKQIAYVTDKNGCHICTSHTPSTHGYPMLSHLRQNKRANMHRVLYEERFGELPKGLVVRHTCDNRLCINLAHLVPGTQADNCADIVARRRQNPPRGERCGTAKLTRNQVELIRQLEGSQGSIAKTFGVNQSTISAIKRKVTWL